MKSRTFKERLEAGLKSMGWKESTGATRKYTIFVKDGVRPKMFVGKSGALRTGSNATSSRSIGCPGDYTSLGPKDTKDLYLQILEAGDKALAEPVMEYTVHWTEKDTFDGKVTQHWRDFPSFEEAEQFHNANKEIRQCKLEAIKDCPWNPLCADHPSRA